MLTFVACNQIDDDLSDCEVMPQPQPEQDAEFQINLITKLTTNIEAELSTVDNKEVQDAIREYLKNIFVEYAHDIDLSFFGMEGDSTRVYHENHIMDASQHAYSMHLPVSNYMHASYANIENNPLISPAGVNLCHDLILNQVKRDTIASHNTGLFTGRLPMRVDRNVSQTFNVNLYMANCSSALVIDSVGVKANRVVAYATGFATDFQIADSAFVYPALSPIVKSDLLGVSNKAKAVAFCNVNFPSRNPDHLTIEDVTVTTRADGLLTQDNSDINEKQSLWRYVVLVTLPGGSVTRSVLWIKEPLLAGQLKIIKGYLDEQGGVHTSDKSVVGVSITLDWQQGGQYEPVL